ncbi:hypothetical protein B0H66DRAFT_587775 [Apodospora peruviana]|uniref:Uncharacterized protein n=1 Tax=Apodospora peruviana TaxID=516989 RepID=A0AAE0IGV2_9PEZI|nr:hypothetical protein B0H66DRAFT_587775 [Apodospora peruviana]
MDEPYPLQTTTYADYRALTQVLWGWHDCPGALSRETGQKEPEVASCGSECPWNRYSALAQFHALYGRLVSSYVPDLGYGCSPALRHHGDLLNIIKCLKSKPDVSRTQLRSQYFDDRRKANEVDMPTPEDQDRAFSLAARIMTGVACSSEDVETSPLARGTSISQSLVTTFPLANTLSAAASPTSGSGHDIRSRLSAETITKAGNLRLQPNDDIQSHLCLDFKAGTLCVYQQPSILKSTSGRPGIYRPQPSCLKKCKARVTRPPTKHEAKGEYRYLASKLRGLYDKIENPTPRGHFQTWFERRIAQRYFMMATLGGLLVAIILGLLGLAVGIFQAWVTYQQWKFPVKGGN